MQRQAMGVALHIVLLPFLNYCIAQLIRTTPTLMSRLFLCTENPQLGWGFRKAFSFEPVIKTPFDLLKHLAVWQLQVSNK
ncbi:hypothetical protein ELY07_14130, partial [Escherichia coli]|uniref:hypothetical protein n=3 Tax=Escherichia coli TaxID=562 RepID=UPI001103D740